MFSWYKSAAECFVYLEDVQTGGVGETLLLDEAQREATWRDWCLQVKRSRWLTRGWTLQELIAPKSVILYNCDWKYMSNLWNFRNEMVDVIGIPESMLGNRGINIEEFGKTNL